VQKKLTNTVTAKPSTALIPFRAAGPASFISSSTSKPASALQPAQPNGNTLVSTGKPRREVPLPSQEKKEGVMQYALYVSPKAVSWQL
jgi:NADH dehydrogenase (ubiquinone) Fe-S protein 7